MKMSKTAKRLLAGTLVLAAIAGGAWFWKAKFGEKPPQYTTEQVARGDIARVVSATGTIQAVNTGGATGRYVMWCSAIWPSSSAGLNSSTNTTVAPARTDSESTQFRP